MRQAMEFSSQVGFREADLAQKREETAANAAFAALVRRQSRFVYKVAYSILRNIQDAEDATQECFLKLYRNNSWTGIQDERAFLARAAWRIAVDKLSKHVPSSPDRSLESSAATPEQLAVDADCRTIVHKLMDALPEELRQPLALSALDELNSSQIGKVLGISDATVRSRLLRARQILKIKLTALTHRGACGQ
jgi:RNA polymerase sigma-70 factor (ECF subfamily)